MEIVEPCRKLIAADSTPSQGNWQAAQIAMGFCKEFGFEIESFEEIFGDHRQMNFLARPAGLTPDHGKDEVLLQTHLDTPDPGPFGLWQKTGHNPFDAHIIDNRIYGLGTADTKLDFICKVFALRDLQKEVADGKKTWKSIPTLMATFGEEQGMVGALKLIRKNKIKATRALIGEPSGGHLIMAGKGIATVEIRIPFEKDEMEYRRLHDLTASSSTESRLFSGKAAHSSTPHLGESAITKLFNYLKQLPEDITIMDIGGGVNFNTVPARAFLEIEPVSGHRQPMAKKLNVIHSAIVELEQEFLQFSDSRFRPAEPTLNVGMIKHFEDHVDIFGNCRMNPDVDQTRYEKWMIELGKACASVGAEFRVTDYKKPFLTSLESDFAKGCLQELRALSPKAELVTQSSTNEASLFSRLGIECLGFGPGEREGNIHTPNENVSLEDLSHAIEFYKRALRRFCL